MLSATLSLALVLVSPTAHCFVAKATQGCFFDINEDLPEPSPLILWDAPKPQFRYPDNGAGSEIRLSIGETLRLSCGDDGSFQWDGKSKQTKRSIAAGESKDIRAVCVRDQLVRVHDQEVLLSSLACERPVNSEATSNGTCSHASRTAAARTLTRINVGFAVGDSLVRTLEMCFDQGALDAVYSRSTVSPKVSHHQTHVPRPFFMPGPFYQGTDIDALYKRQRQRKTLATILRSPDLAAFYLKTKGDLYLARGHLVPKADLVYGQAQRSTFQYPNTAPQWQAFNQGNWERVEAAVRALAVARNAELDVATGVHGIATLADVDGVQQPLHLLVDGDRRRIRVPLYFWKAVFHPQSAAGVVLVGVNNPYHVVTQQDIFCDDVCDQLAWLHLPKRKHQVAGYVFCCEMDSFRRVVPEMPSFTVTSLLV